jgi:hypothetical protein
MGVYLINVHLTGVHLIGVHLTGVLICKISIAVSRWNQLTLTVDHGLPAKSVA